MTLVQILLLAGFGGIAYAATAKAEQTAKFLTQAGEVAEQAYNTLEERVSKFAGKPSETVAAKPRDASGEDATTV